METSSRNSPTLTNRNTKESIGARGMSENTVQELGLNLDALRVAIQEEYGAVALNPQQGFHFHTGRPLAQMLGYRDPWLEGIPETSIESFAGTGNPSSIDEIGGGAEGGCGLWCRYRQPDRRQNGGSERQGHRRGYAPSDAGEGTAQRIRGR